MHRLQRRADELGARDIEFRQLALLSIEQVHRGRRNDRVHRNGPELIIFRAGRNADIAFQLLSQPGEIRSNLWIDCNPFIAQIGHGIGLDFTAPRVAHGIADVRSRALADHRRFAGCHILRNQSSGVATATVDPIKRLAVSGESTRLCRQRILKRGRSDRLFVDGVISHREKVVASIGIWAQCHTDSQIGIGQKSGITIAAHDLRQLAGLELQTVHVVPTCIAIIQADENSVFDQGGDIDDLDAGLLKGSQGSLNTACDIDAIQQEVFVTTLILNVHHHAAVG